MVPIYSPGVVSYLTSIDLTVISVTDLEIFGIAVKLSYISALSKWRAKRAGLIELCRCVQCCHAFQHVVGS